MGDKDLNIYLAENMINESGWTKIFTVIIEEVNKTPLTTLSHLYSWSLMAQIEYLIHKLNLELKLHRGNK